MKGIGTDARTYRISKVTRVSCEEFGRVYGPWSVMALIPCAHRICYAVDRRTWQVSMMYFPGTDPKVTPKCKVTLEYLIVVER